MAVIIESSVLEANRHYRKEVVVEKIYKAMKSVGSFNVVVGILMIVSGIAFGIMVITKGAKLLKHKSDLTF